MSLGLDLPGPGIHGDSSLLDDRDVTQGDGNSSSLFSIEQVQLMFTLNDIAFLQVANNVLCMALRSGRIIRIDLGHPEVVDDIDLPKKTQDKGSTPVIANIFLDPTGSHLLITTASGDNYMLHYQSTKVKVLGRLKGLVVTSVAWCPLEPSRSTGPILLGCSDGTVRETLVESSNEYFKREDRYIRQVWKSPDGSSIDGVYAYQKNPSYSSNRHVFVTCNGNIWHWQGKVPVKSGSDLFPIYPAIFDKYEPDSEQFTSGGTPGVIAVSPLTDNKSTPDLFGWTNGLGIMLINISDNDKIFDGSKMILFSEIFPNASSSSKHTNAKAVKSLLLTEYHVIIVIADEVTIVNRLTSKVVHREQIVSEDGKSSVLISGCCDIKYATYWVFTNSDISEIRLTREESEDIWKTFLENKDYEEALRVANTAYAKDTVAVEYGARLLDKEEYLKAVTLLGPSSKPFESVATILIDKKESEALKNFLQLRLKTAKSSGVMQKIILTSWLVELYMEKFSQVDDIIATESGKGRLSNSNGTSSNPSSNSKREALKLEFEQFINANKDNLDRGTVFEIISSHGRREQLLYFATSVADTEFVLRYWINNENWKEALKVLRDANDPKMAYKYSSVLLMNSPKETVETWMRINNMDPAKLLPALLSYFSWFRASIKPETNQAIRYLRFAIYQMKVSDPVIFNTLISIYASSPNISESTLLEFLQEQGNGKYDSDFTLRICTQFNRIRCSVHIFCSIGLYEDAVDLALSRGNIELAKLVADKPVSDPDLRRDLWLQIARTVIETNKHEDSGFDKAVELLDQCELLKVEDVLPFFPDFTVIGSFKDKILESIENYFASIGRLNAETEESIEITANVKKEIDAYKKRYVLIEPGECCGLCNFPLATRKFYVFPCQHAFHSDCLANEIMKSAGSKLKSIVAEIKAKAPKKEISDSLDKILSASCVLCNDSKVEDIDAPLIPVNESSGVANPWAL